MNPEHKKPTLTADGVLVRGNKVLLLRRSIEPFKGHWILPGGHVEYGETVERAIGREVLEETGLSLDNLDLFGVYSDPGRDPRGHTVSCVYLIEVSDTEEISLDRESDDFGFYKFNGLPGKMGFDHRKIVKDVADYLN